MLQRLFILNKKNTSIEMLDFNIQWNLDNSIFFWPSTELLRFYRISYFNLTT